MRNDKTLEAVETLLRQEEYSVIDESGREEILSNYLEAVKYAQEISNENFIACVVCDGVKVY
jgi:hypothetical protein